MKKVYLLAALLFGLHSATMAASELEIENPAAIQARAITLTRAMAEKMHLEEGQYLKLKQINIRMLTAMEDAQKRYAGEPAAMDEHLAAIQSQYQAETLELLHPAQLLAYEQLLNNRTALNSTNK